MKQNGKLSLALHALGHMAGQPALPVTSDVVAAQNRTNPVVVRRVLGLLRNHGLVTSARGHAGGWLLARPPQSISVADVYLALGEPFLTARPLAGGPHCAIVTTLHRHVTAAMAEAETVMLRHLAMTTLADLASAMQPCNVPAGTQA